MFDEKGSAREQNRDAELDRSFYAKIGQLVVERDFVESLSIAEPGSEEDDDRPRSSTGLLDPCASASCVLISR